MAYLELNYHSNALQMGVNVNVILPENAKAAGDGETYKTLYLFHGLSDDHTMWMRRTSIERYASAHGIAVVMPAVGRSWYTNTADGANYLTYVTEELPSVCRSYFRGMSAKREDNLVAGLSMGGYGAVKAAMVRPDLFGGCASLSGALNIARERLDLREWRRIFGFDLKDCLELAGTEHDTMELVRRNHAAGLPFPRLYLWCGTDDILLSHSQKFSSLLTELGIKHRYEETAGNHSWPYWDQYIQTALSYLLSAEA